ncbi:hypothetical protein AKJ63_00435 [candidate division MSBL1 archaeon SCGC-AAA259D18]|uniref:Uncharacterized protein n=1 Tax=candidate division MSBL1 archaeon SCGC-AAA259D18 TaxID=1698262 RepID=A0A133UCJ7_9EURY|nr:hypothetical protein AKJ63_00435 [candidate division MSBL1 archaeon SCGC-AAA259D18]
MHGKSRTAAKTCSGAMKIFAGFFDPAPNSVYGSFDLAQSIMKMGIDGASAESRSRPSPDVVLRRLYQVDEKSARRELEDFNEWWVMMCDGDDGENQVQGISRAEKITKLVKGGFRCEFSSQTRSGRERGDSGGGTRFSRWVVPDLRVETILS